MIPPSAQLGMDNELAREVETLRKELATARAVVDTARDTLRYPRYGDTATLLRKAAENIDRYCENGWRSTFSPHLLHAAERVDAALAAIAAHDTEQSEAKQLTDA